MKITSKINTLHFSMNRKPLPHVYLLFIATFREHQSLLQTCTALAHPLSNCKLCNAVLLQQDCMVLAAAAGMLCSNDTAV